MINKGIEVISTGYDVPAKVVTNFDFEKTLDTSNEWIVERTGIKQRYFVENETNIDLATNAAKNALEGLDISKLKYIIVATITPTQHTPSMACMVQKNLGLNDQQIMAFDINAACSGFVYGLEVMRSLMQGDQDSYGLVIGSEVLSSILDMNDRSSCVLFGDGAGAVVVKSSDQIYASYLDASGDNEVLYTDENNYLQMQGIDVFKFAIGAIPKCINQVLSKTNLTLDDIDHVVCHQANIRIIENVVKKLKVDPQKFYVNVQDFGNTSAASIPLALATMDQKGMIKKGDKVICIGFGAGLTWGANLIQW